MSNSNFKELKRPTSLISLKKFQMSSSNYMVTEIIQMIPLDRVCNLAGQSVAFIGHQKVKQQEIFEKLALRPKATVKHFEL